VSEKKRILVIDDEPDFLYTLRMRLEHEGFEVVEASDGLSGLEALRKGDVDLILLDIMMPRMDGFTFLKTVREEAPAFPVPPIIVLTAYMRTIDDDKQKLLGETPVIAKPFEYAELSEKIKEAVEK